MKNRATKSIFGVLENFYYLCKTNYYYLYAKEQRHTSYDD